MSWLRSILDAALETTARASLRLLGRDVSGDEDSLLPQEDRDTVIARCYDLRRNNPVAAGVAVGLADNIAGSRCMMQARTSDKGWNAAAEAWFRRWSRRCDASGRIGFSELLRHAVAARLFAGEIFCVPQPDGTLSVVESQRVRPPQGESLAYRADKKGRVTGWHIADRDPVSGDFRAGGPGRWVADAIHCVWRWRPDQVRGWPQLAPVANACQDLGEINSANLRKYKMGAIAAWTLTGGGRLRGRSQSNSSTPLARFREGQIYELEEGQSLQPFNNSQPGGEYAPFVTVNLQLIGMALRLPYEFLLQYFGGSTYASSKAALEQVHVTISSWQDWLEEQMIRPVLEWRVARAIADGELPPAPVDKDGRSQWDKWEWQRPAVLWLDPQAAVQGEMQEIRMGVGTLKAAAAARGRDLEETLRARAAELRLAADIAAEYNVSADALSSIQIPGQNATPAKDEGRRTNDEGEEDAR